MSSTNRKIKPLCDCGRPAVRVKNSAWQCERCLAIKPDDYHHMTAGIRIVVNEFIGITKGTRHE